MHTSPRLVVALIATLATTPVAAQSLGSLSGIVYDSLAAGAPLEGAEVWATGTTRTTRTDAKGRFRLDSLPAGPTRVAFFHPTLAALDLSPPAPQVTIVAGQNTETVLATPSAARVYAALCGQAQPPKSGFVLGVVRDEKGNPIAKVSVGASWTDYSITQGGLRKTDRESSGQTDADGKYLLCAVPSDVPILVRYEALDGSLALGEVNMQSRGFLVRPVTLAQGGVSARDSAELAAARTRGIISGMVRTTDGQPVAGAEAQVIGAMATTSSDGDGTFRIVDAPIGQQVVEVRMIGFRPVRTQVAVSPGRISRLSVLLDRSVVVLNPLEVVSDDRAARDITGFEERRKSGQGYFFDETQIAKRNPARINDLFTVIPGAHVEFGQFGESYVNFQRAAGQVGVMANGCPPIYFIDGVQINVGLSSALDDTQQAPNPDLVARPSDIRGIEVYPNGWGAPVQYQPLNNSCGVILIWTKSGRR